MDAPESIKMSGNITPADLQKWIVDIKREVRDTADGPGLPGVTWEQQGFSNFRYLFRLFLDDYDRVYCGDSRARPES